MRPTSDEQPREVGIGTGTGSEGQMSRNQTTTVDEECPTGSIVPERKEGMGYIRVISYQTLVFTGVKD